MASLLPEIEVFTTDENCARSIDCIKNTPLKFAKNLKVLDLTGIGYSSSYTFINTSNAVIDKLENDEVLHIGLVSFYLNPVYFHWYMEVEEMKGCWLVAECAAKILSRVPVDHVVFQNSCCLDQIYAVCAKISDMHLQNPIHIYFPEGVDYRYRATDPSRPLRIGLDSVHRESLRPRPGQGYDGFCLNLRLNHRVMNDSEPSFLSSINEDQIDTFMMITVHIYIGKKDKADRSMFTALRAAQGLWLENFPNIDVKPYYGPDRICIVEMCSYLGITSAYEWPIQVSRQSMYKATRDGDTKSACFDSRMGYHTEMYLNSMLNLSESLEKISAEVGPPHHCVTVAVLDTGILASHSAFLDKIVAVKNFVPNEAGDLCYDYNGHGTGCAGILLRIAPFVRLVICKVMSSRGHGQLKWAADAIHWLLKDETGPKNYCPVDIISMSFGGNSFDSNLRRTVSEAVACGKVVVAAASNDGRKRMTNIAFPARFGDVICVGSCNNLGQPSSFTPTGREIDFLAPGEGIYDTIVSSADYALGLRSGTSEATPIVAGIAAMVISYAEAVGGRPMRTTVCHTAVMREVLRKMASMPGHHDEHMGYGNLDPWRLFKYVYGPDHFRQVVEEIVGPLPAEPQSHQPVNKLKRKRRASDSEVHMKKGGELQ